MAKSPRAHFNRFTYLVLQIALKTHTDNISKI